MSRSRGRIVLLLSGALAVCGGAAYATDPADDPPAQRDQEPVQQVDPEQSSRFSVMRRVRTDADELPAAAHAFVEGSVSGDNGAAPSLARRATTTPSGSAVFVVPGRGWLCTYVVHGEGGGGGCNRTAAAIQGQVVSTSSPSAGVTRVVGVVPDGVQEVRLRLKDGATERTVPQGNAYVFETNGLPREVEFGGEVVHVVSPLEVG